MEAAEAGMSMPLIIPDLQDSQMFALAQAAGRAGIPVLGSSWYMEPWVKSSLYIQQKVEMPGLSTMTEGDYVLHWKQTGFSGVWLPCVDDMVNFTAKYQTLLANIGMRFVCPDSETLERAYSIHHEAFSGVLKLPDTNVISVDKLRRYAGQFKYPLMLKSARNYFVRIESPEMLHQYIDEQDLMASPEVEQRVQSYVDGDVSRMATAMVLFDNTGSPVRGFTGRRLRVEPTHFGPFGETLSARAEWIPELYEGAVELLSSIGWRGFAEVECKQGVDGHWYLLEVNPRTSGWMCLAEADGAGFLAAYHSMCANGMRLQEACLQRSKAEYFRLIATGYHHPDWAVDAIGKRSMGERVKPLLRMLFGENNPNICFGAWDRKDLKASLLILGRTMKRVWQRYWLRKDGV